MPNYTVGTYCGSISNAGDYYTYGETFDTGNTYQEPVQIVTPFVYSETPTVGINSLKNRKEEEDMMYLWDVFLVNPKDDTFEVYNVTAKSETSALMYAYNLSQIGEDSEISGIEFDDLKTKCNVLMEWKKEKDLEKAIKTIKKAVE